MKKRMKSFLKAGCVTKIAYVGNETSTRFCVKEVTKVKYNQDIICQGRCPEIGRNDHYLEELVIGYRSLGPRWERSKFTSFQTFCRK